MLSKQKWFVTCNSHILFKNKKSLISLSSELSSSLVMKTRCHWVCHYSCTKWLVPLQSSHISEHGRLLLVYLHCDAHSILSQACLISWKTTSGAHGLSHITVASRPSSRNQPCLIGDNTVGCVMLSCCHIILCHINIIPWFYITYLPGNC